MVVATDIFHKYTHLAVVDLAPVTTPLALHSHRMRAALRETARIEGDDAIGFPQLLDHFSDQHLDQWPVIPGRRANEVLQDEALDMDEGGAIFSILAGQVGQQSLEIEV